MLVIIFNIFFYYIDMFYSSNGNFSGLDVIENFSPNSNDLELINKFKDNVRYASLEVNDRNNLDKLIEFIVTEANRYLNEYLSINNEAEKVAKRNQIHTNLLSNKNNNNIYRTLERMILYNGGKEYLDDLYNNQLSLFNSILNINNWKSDIIDNSTCKSIKTDLSSEFENYNKSKSDKETALLNKIQIEKQLIIAQNNINKAINNINEAARKYNDLLKKSHLKNC